jgi:hypothetical protein
VQLCRTTSDASERKPPEAKRHKQTVDAIIAAALAIIENLIAEKQDVARGCVARVCPSAADSVRVIGLAKQMTQM